MKNFEKYWKELETKEYYTGASDKDKIRWGYIQALKWVLEEGTLLNSLCWSLSEDIKEELNE